MTPRRDEPPSRGERFRPRGSIRRREVSVPDHEEAASAARKQPHRLQKWSAADGSPVESPLKRSDGERISVPRYESV
jgi:hypothetical protein